MTVGRMAVVVAVSVVVVGWADVLEAGAIYVPNASFESPNVPDASPYATATITDWQKASVPDWWLASGYDADSWYNSVGVFRDVPFAHIDNIDGKQAAFFFATPGVELFQDLDARFEIGQSYHLTAGFIGGGYGMKLGVPIEMRLYYRDDAGGRVTVGSTTVTNTNTSGSLFHLVDYQLDTSVVAGSDPWAGRYIGVQLISTVDFDNAGGFWDVDNVRLTSVPEPVSAFLLTLGGVVLGLRRRR